MCTRYGFLGKTYLADRSPTTVLSSCLAWEFGCFTHNSPESPVKPGHSPTTLATTSAGSSHCCLLCLAASTIMFDSLMSCFLSSASGRGPPAPHSISGGALSLPRECEWPALPAAVHSHAHQSPEGHRHWSAHQSQLFSAGNPSKLVIEKFGSRTQIHRDAEVEWRTWVSLTHSSGYSLLTLIFCLTQYFFFFIQK